MNGLIYLIGLIVVILFILFVPRPPLSVALGKGQQTWQSRSVPKSWRSELPPLSCNGRPVFAGALVASAVSLVLIAFGTAIGLGIVSSSPTWRDTSPALTMIAGLYLLLAALVSFGVGGCGGAAPGTLGPFCAQRCGRVPGCTHGIVAWALAVVITGIVAAVSVASLVIQDSAAGYFFVDDSGRASHRL